MPLQANPFTTFSFCPTYDRTFQVFVEAPGTFVCLTATVVIPILAILIPTAILMDSVDPIYRTATDFAFYVTTLVIELAVYLAFAMVGKGAMIQAVTEIYLGQSPNWWACFKAAFRQLPTLFCFSLIVGLVVFVSTLLPAGLVSASNSKDGLNVALNILAIVAIVLCTAWMVFLWVALFNTIPSIMIEKESALGSIKRSYGLSIGYRCYIACVTSLLFMATWVALLILGPLGQVLSIVLFPIHTILEAVIYFNLRVAKDGLDRETLARELNLEPEIEVSSGVDDKQQEVENDIV